MTSIYAAARVGTRRVREDAGKWRNDSIGASAQRVQFSLGRLFATPGALSLLVKLRDVGKPYSVQHVAQADDPMSLALPYIRRHASGDWGDVSDEDCAANDEALKIGERLFSAYQLSVDARLWIITEADRSSTTVLLPEDY